MISSCLHTWQASQVVSLIQSVAHTPRETAREVQLAFKEWKWNGHVGLLSSADRMRLKLVHIQFVAANNFAARSLWHSSHDSSQILSAQYTSEVTGERRREQNNRLSITGYPQRQKTHACFGGFFRACVVLSVCVAACVCEWARARVS